MSERTAFEATLMKEGYSPRRLRRHVNGRYESMPVNRMFTLWQASRRAALEEAAAVVSDRERKGREWIAGSLWDNLANECAARIRALQEKKP